MKISDLMRGRTEEEINALLSGLRISTPGFDNPQPEQQMPQNYIKNNTTGSTYDLGPSRNPGANMDYSSAPVEIAGYGKGYRLKGDPFNVVLSDGRIVRLGEDTDAAMKRQSAQLDIAKKQQELITNGRPYYQFLPTEKGIAIGDTRAGTLKLGELQGQAGPVMRASDSPELQGRISGSKEQAQADVKTRADANKSLTTSDQLLSAAERAKALLNTNTTDSGIGAIADKVSGFVGYSPESSQNAASLETLSGWMTANVPRMEGPQSNYDVENYRIMAGKVGDRTVPVEERKKALSELVRLQEKYRHLNQDKIDKTPSYGSAQKPSLQEWMQKARLANPTASGAQLEQFYYQKYGMK